MNSTGFKTGESVDCKIEMEMEIFCCYFECCCPSRFALVKFRRIGEVDCSLARRNLRLFQLYLFCCFCFHFQIGFSELKLRVVCFRDP